MLSSSSLLLVLLAALHAASAAAAALLRRADRAAGAAAGQGLLRRLGAEQELPGSHCVLPKGMVYTDGAVKMAVYREDQAGRDTVSDAVNRTGFWEIHQAADIARPAGRHLPARGTFLDIGANLGWYSLLFAVSGYRVVAVEPLPENVAALEATLCLYPRLRSLVTIVPVALVAPGQASQRCVIRGSDFDRHLLWGRAMENIGNGRLSCGSSDEVRPCGPREPHCVEPRVATLDSVISELVRAWKTEALDSIDVVKLDVEDFECQVLSGGQEMMRSYTPEFVQVEAESPEAMRCAHAQAEAHGYRIFNATHANKDLLLAKL